MPQSGPFAKMESYNSKMTVEQQSIPADRVVDARGLQCPMPLLKTKLALNEMHPGEVLEVLASDAGSVRDIPAFLKLSSHQLVNLEQTADTYHFLIRCG